MAQVQLGSLLFVRYIIFGYKFTCKIKFICFNPSGLPVSACDLQVIHWKKSLQVQVWVLAPKIPVGRIQVNPRVHPCPALAKLD